MTSLGCSDFSPHPLMSVATVATVATLHLSAILAAKAAPLQCYMLAIWVKRQIDSGLHRWERPGRAGIMLTVSVVDHFPLQAHLRSNTEYEVRVKEACSELREPLGNP